jgi:hypothetical protein
MGFAGLNPSYELPRSCVTEPVEQAFDEQLLTGRVDVPPGRFRASLRASLESVHLESVPAEQAKPGAPETDPKTGMI